MPKAIELSIINVALEYAFFKDYRVRDSLVKLLKELQLDLEEVAFEPAEQTKKAIAALEDTITDIESARAPKPSRFEVDESIIPITSIKSTIPEDDGIVSFIESTIEEDISPPKNHIVNVDAELDDQPT